MKKKGSLNVHRFQEIEKSLDRQGQQKTGSQHGPDSSTQVLLGVGSEETGHNITTGWLTCEDGKRIPVFFGNGLKSAINTFTATEFLFRGKSARTYFSRLRKPFPTGLKKTMYTYYIRPDRFKNKSKVWGAVKKVILQNAKKLGYRGTVAKFPEDPDMLYIALKKGTDKNNTAGVFVRNSGTENKISVNLRGGKKDARNLTIIGEDAIRLLMSAMKDTDNHYYKLELDILSQVAGGPILENRIVTEQRARTRLLAEMKKQNLIQLTVNGLQLTQRGQWYITSG